jgi:hypothetical protein
MCMNEVSSCIKRANSQRANPPWTHANCINIGRNSPSVCKNGAFDRPEPDEVRTFPLPIPARRQFAIAALPETMRSPSREGGRAFRLVVDGERHTLVRSTVVAHVCEDAACQQGSGGRPFRRCNGTVRVGADNLPGFVDVVRCPIADSLTTTRSKCSPPAMRRERRRPCRCRPTGGGRSGARIRGRSPRQPA